MLNVETSVVVFAATKKSKHPKNATWGLSSMGEYSFNLQKSEADKEF
jgi:hypothetical protein